ncbi:MAG TPA: type II secretion system F family protein [Anaerolineaceae bacterium]
MDNLLYLAIGLIVLIIVVAIILVVIGLRNPRSVNDQILQQRLEEYNQRGETPSLEELEHSLPFTERIIFPIARKMGDFVIQFTPQKALQTIARKLELAGSPAKLDPTLFLSLQLFAALFFGGAVFLATAFGTAKWPLGRVFLVTIAVALVGFYFPQLWLTSKINRRQKEVRKAMPDALDLLTICVEAGLGFDAAMAKVSEKWESELSLAFARVIQEVQLGKIRREALRDMADRIGIQEMNSFVAAIIQSEVLGVSLAKVLRIQSDQMRIRRRQLAEEEAHKAPIKMLFPMALLIFPALVIVLLTPAGLKLWNSVLFGMLR